MNTSTDSINFTREAFLHPVNLGFLFLSALTAFFVNDYGTLPNLVFTMAIGMELVYLGTVPRSDLFRRSVMARFMRERPRDVEEKEVFYGLGTASQKRFLVLRHISEKVEANFKKFPQTSQGLTVNIKNKIQELLSNYIYMLDSLERYGAFIKATRKEDLADEIASVEQEITGIESEKLREIKNRRLAILRKRQQKLQAAHERLQVCHSQLETIEDAVRYIYEQSITMSNPEQIGFQLDNLLQDVEETVSIVEDLEDHSLPGFTIIEKMDNFDENVDIGAPVKSRQRN
jgi:ElaB/YqjD/DUF883 family membrane-anchored ribosome-binding protein